MADLGIDTAVESCGDGRYRATLSNAWEIWGPMGGFVASVALRAAGAETVFPRPASFTCHYLSVAKFDTVELAVTELRSTKVAASYRVEMTQGDRRILEALVWAVDDGIEALIHDEAVAPDVEGPDGLRNFEELFADVEDSAGPPFPFWSNFESRPLDFSYDWPPAGPMPPRYQQWHRFLEGDFSDPWVDACRAVVLVDVQSWPSASRPHAWKNSNLYAPSLDVSVSFHRPATTDWLMTDGYSPVGEGGLLGWNGRLWTSDRKLVATGGGQALCRPMRMPQ
ncbi:MAG TPA: thioesterase family protein [Acidimicrobiales bacterium]|jgi:acyl-CoA thioesterase-2